MIEPAFGLGVYRESTPSYATKAPMVDALYECGPVADSVSQSHEHKSDSHAPWKQHKSRLSSTDLSTTVFQVRVASPRIVIISHALACDLSAVYRYFVA